MNKYKIAKALAWITIIVSLAVIIGWVFDIPLLTSILPQWVTMKFTTAFSFLLAGGVLYYITKRISGEFSIYGLTVPVFSVLLLFLMGILLVSVLIGVRTGIEDLFVRETGETVFTTTPGRPSIGTMLNFILIGFIGLFSLFDSRYLDKITKWFGFGVAIIGIFALSGYIFNIPGLYYTIEGISSAMAIHTAILFIILGAGFFIVGRRQEKNQPEEKDEIKSSNN